MPEWYHLRPLQRLVVAKLLQDNTRYLNAALGNFSINDPSISLISTARVAVYLRVFGVKVWFHADDVTGTIEQLPDEQADHPGIGTVYMPSGSGFAVHILLQKGTTGGEFGDGDPEIATEMETKRFCQGLTMAVLRKYVKDALTNQGASYAQRHGF